MTDIARLIAELRDVLVDCGIPFYIGGSVASSVWGNPRQTNDADFVVMMQETQVDCLAERLEPEYMLSRSSMIEAIRSGQPFASFQLLHMEQLWKFDVFVRHEDGHTTEIFKRVRQVRVFEDVEVACAGPEDIVIQKLRWFELGNRVSDRQWNDIVQVLEVQRGLLDEPYLDKWADHFGLRELLDEARAQAFD